MEHVSRSMEFPVPAVHMGMVPNMSTYREQQHFSMPMDQMSYVGSMPYDSEFNRQFIGDVPMLDSVSVHDKLLPAERKTEMTQALNNSISQQVQLPNKHTVNLGADGGPLGSFQSSISQRKTGPMQQKLGSPGSQAQSALSKRKVRSEPNGKPGLQRGRPLKKQTVKVDSITKPQSESSDAVRSKMRESLAAALALASQKPENVSAPKKDESEHTITHQMHIGGQPADSNSMTDGNVPHSVSRELVPSQGLVLGSSTTSDSQEISPKGSNFSGGQSFGGLQFNSILSDGDVQFSDIAFAKDDLLQGNGLSWALQVDSQKEEGKGIENADKPPFSLEGANFYDHEYKAENLAFEIEAELFKLYGGINKKYREKGRSLLFNLKDQKNPELRERVMSGEILPGRLCSMSAEELASKELSEWRIAKAEELAQMVVLPDTEVDMRRLVKKTHKGEYQVEYEHDDSIIDEVSGGSSMNAQRLPGKNTGNHPTKDGENAARHEKAPENTELSGSLIIPTDGTDLMQGMMVDEFKDATSLPPIVSLDEFMESLNSEPPFENISEDAAQNNSPLTRDVSPKVVSKTQASGRVSISPRDGPSRRADFGKKNQANMSSKSSGLEKKVLPSSALEVESIWEGILQLNVTSFVAVRGLFQSGEKTATKDWSPSLEIKGRVRLDAFEKFLQELPKSRSRALMIIQFVLKESSESQVSTFSEAVASYTADERLGFAEPAAGVELYLCPPTVRIAELLNRHMSKDGRKTDSSMENGLIGVVVWRRAHVISPNASSHHKHSSKKQPFSPHNRLQDSSNVANVNSSRTARASLPVSNNMSRLKPEPEPEEEDDDIPPGFGPAAPRDEDDLPEFNFVGGFNSSTTMSMTQKKTTPTSVDHVRELIKKYGQSDVVPTSRVESRGLSVQPWDDDDDIPEWRPEGPAHLVARGGSPLLVNRPPPREPVIGGRIRPSHRDVNGARWKY